MVKYYTFLIIFDWCYLGELFKEVHHPCYLSKLLKKSVSERAKLKKNRFTNTQKVI